MSTSGLLSTDQAAGELGCPEIQIKRLIARGRLPARQLGEGGEWRITADDLRQYVQGGAADFDFPPTNLDLADPANWFSSDESHLAAGFESEITIAAEEQIPDKEKLREMFAGKNTETIDYPIAIVGEVSRIVRSPVPTSAAGAALKQFDPTSRYESWTQLFLVSELRKYGQQQLDVGKPALEQLYESPARYQDIVQGATDRLRAGKAAVVSQTVEMPGTPFGRYQVFFTLTNANLLQTTGINVARLAQLAF
jgi:excisionase family DNA binding protein